MLAVVPLITPRRASYAFYPILSRLVYKPIGIAQEINALGSTGNRRIDPAYQVAIFREITDKTQVNKDTGPLPPLRLMCGDGIAILNLQCTPEGIATYGLTSLCDRSNIRIVCCYKIKKSLSLGLATLWSRLLQRAKQQTHLQRIIPIREVDLRISKVRPIFIVVLSEVLYLDDLTIGNEIRSVWSLCIVVVITGYDEAFSRYHSLFFVIQHRAAYGMIALKRQLIGRANNQAFVLSILTISIIQCLDERTSLNWEDATQALRLQVNRKESFGIFIRIFIEQFT